MIRITTHALERFHRRIVPHMSQAEAYQALRVALDESKSAPYVGGRLHHGAKVRECNGIQFIIRNGACATVIGSRQEFPAAEPLELPEESEQPVPPSSPRGSHS